MKTFHYETNIGGNYITQCNYHQINHVDFRSWFGMPGHSDNLVAIFKIKYK